SAIAATLREGVHKESIGWWAHCAGPCPSSQGLLLNASGGMRHMSRLPLVCCMSLWLGTGGFAQSITATISGTAKDQSGAVLPGVEITSTNKDTSSARTVVTKERGE